MKKKQIKYTKLGLANNFDDRIELNINLKKYPKLRKVILKHELSHEDSLDVGREFDISVWKHIPSILLFIAKHPSTWIDFLPIQYRNKFIIVDKNLLCLYSLTLILLLIMKILFF